MLAKPSPLAVALAVSAGLHAGLIAWPDFGNEARAQSSPVRPLSVKLVEAAPGNELAASAERTERTEPREKVLPRPAKYYTSAEVDVKATPLRLKNAVRTSDNFPLGRIATVKVRLFISEQGTVDRFEIVEAEDLPDRNLLDDFRAIQFRPAELGGRPVKSQKVVGISFVP